ncbi:MAG: sigma-54-dependent Fis family transcriptional regulator [Planctomycetes bacterium]|nr:sigma-54-dependent Fis family transcriptional regulator [Planctomycetota bacterium]
MERILIVDDERVVLETLVDVLQAEGFSVAQASDARSALAHLAAEPVAIVLSDIRMPDMDGMELLHDVRRLHPGTDVVLMTGFASVDGAIEAMGAGAADYLIKPLRPKEVIARVRSILQRRRLESQLHSLQSELRSRHELHNLIAQSSRMSAVVTALHRVRDSADPVVVHGEEGVGRRFIARALHYSGARRAAPFEALDARAPSERSFEEQLWGVRTPTGRWRRGWFERLEHGTLHLVGLEALGAHEQELLGRALETLTYTPPGAHEALPIRCRILISLSEAPAEALERGALSPALSVLRTFVNIRVPPLRQRTDDLPGLVAHFAETYAVEHGRTLRIAPRVMDLLASHAFPGNVRQLFAVLSNAATISIDGMLTPEHLERSLRQSNLAAARPIADQLGDREHQVVLQAVQRNPGRLDQAAKELGVSRTTLWRRMRKYGIRLAGAES